MAAFGFDASTVQREEREFYLWPENERTFCIWLRLRTQWNYSAMGQKLGLNYPAVETVLCWEGLKGSKKRETLNALIAMEAQELKVLNSK